MLGVIDVESKVRCVAQTKSLCQFAGKVLAGLRKFLLHLSFDSIARLIVPIDKDLLV